MFHKKVIDYVNSVKSSGCCMCGEKDVACLDFHHLRDKSAEIAKLIENDNLTQIKIEINKCIVLCANCHRKLHYYNLHLEELKQLIVAHSYTQLSRRVEIDARTRGKLLHKTEVAARHNVTT